MRYLTTPANFLSVLVFLFCALATEFGRPHLSAAEETSPATTTMRVGTRNAPPFSYQNGQGEWNGISLRLLEFIAEQNNLNYELINYNTMADLLDAVQTKDIDLALAAITITPEREALMDFSHPFYFTGLGIATSKTATTTSWWVVISSLVSADFLKVIGTLAAILTIIGVLMWLAERRHNPQFENHPLRGIGAGFWWSAVTMTTVGYGDKAPITLLGRGVALVWMFAALIMIASITAQITSSLTLSAFNQGISGPDDLTANRVGVVRSTTAAEYATVQRLTRNEYPTLNDALNALENGAVQAVVHDHPLLTYQVQQGKRDSLTVLDNTFERQDYGIALPLGSPLRKDINQALVEFVTSEPWVNELKDYNLR